MRKRQEILMARKLVASGSPLEPAIGFSRAVRSGPCLAVAGTAPIGPDGRAVHRGDVYEQTKACLTIAPHGDRGGGRAARRYSSNPRDADRHRPLAGGGARAWRVFWRHSPRLHFRRRCAIHRSGMAGRSRDRLLSRRRMSPLPGPARRARRARSDTPAGDVAARTCLVSHGRTKSARIDLGGRIGK